MILPCTHESDDIDPEIASNTMRGGCGVCYSWLHDPALKKHYSNTPEPKTGQPKRPECQHLGEVTGEKIRCPYCRGNVSVKLRACKIYNKCSPSKQLPGIACCAPEANCPGYVPVSQPGVV